MEIFVQKDGQQTGPFEETVIRDRLSSGEFAASDMAWAEGRTGWEPLGVFLDHNAALETAVSANNGKGPPPIRAGAESHDVLGQDAASAFGMEDGGELGIARTIGIFKSLDYGFLIPFRTILSLKLLRKKAVRWVMLLGLAPIAIYVFAIRFGLSFQETVWMFEIYFCLFWAVYFYTLIRPPQGVWTRAIGYALFTILVGMPCDLLIQRLPFLRNLYANSEAGFFVSKVVGLIAGVGVVEETIKAVPLLIFGVRNEKLRGVREGIFLGFMSGLGFAAAEGVVYSFGAAVQASQANADAADATFTFQLLETIFRFMSSPLLHGAWGGVTGWFIGLSMKQRDTRWPVIIIGIAFMALLHGVNDVVAGSVFQLVTAGLTILIFMAYLIHGEEQKAHAPPQGIQETSVPTVGSISR